MSQFAFGDRTSPLSGTELIDGILEPTFAAIISGHSGPTRPPYIEAGGEWVKTSTNPWIKYMFDGSDDIALGTINITTNVFTPTGLNQNASAHIFDPTGLTYATASNVQAAIQQVDAKLVSLNAASGKVDFAAMATEASIALADYILLNDVSESSGANNKMLITDLLKVLNLLTEDTTPDKANDFLLSYDASAGACKKVRMSNSGGGIQLGTPVTSSVAFVEFTGIPAGVKRITFMYSGLSGSGTSLFILQLGSSAGYVTTGYLASGSQIASGVASTTFTTGIGLLGGGVSAAGAISGNIYITLMNSTTNRFQAIGAGNFDNVVGTSVAGGGVTLPGVIDRLKLTTVNGTDLIDAGSLNISYEV